MFSGNNIMHIHPQGFMIVHPQPHPQGFMIVQPQPGFMVMSTNDMICADVGARTRQRNMNN